MKLSFYTNNDSYFLGRNLSELEKFKFKPPLKIKSDDLNFEKLFNEQYECIYICSGRENENLLLFERIKEHVIINNMSFAIKEHPNFSNTYIDKNIPRIKSYIPSELLIYSKCKLVIGDYSFSLNNISNYINTISLVKLFNYPNKAWINNILDNHLTNKNIYMPDDLKNLKNYILSLK